MSGSFSEQTSNEPIHWLTNQTAEEAAVALLRIEAAPTS